MGEHILVVDDESWVVGLVQGYLEQAGFRVSTASDGPSALERFEADDPDLVILDWMLPRLDGLEVTRRIRAQSKVPIILLTARADEGDRVTGLETGADDYVVKPFSARELEARVRAVLRRADGRVGRSSVLEVGGIRLDLARHEVSVEGRPVELSPMEFDLLAFLMERPGRAFTRLELLEAVRGVTYESFERSIDSHVKRLRQKIEPDPKRPRLLLTVFGVGYRLAGGKP
ncbi:MAG: response regulator transcription factor [Candidatus Bipolaricaulota bacterium]|nr:response regulator transcription factor [Candidatus Bipolaricaulota bacterium]